MIEYIASAKYQAALYLISNLFVYSSVNDIYVPRYGAVDGKVMRAFMDAVSGMSLAKKGIVDSEILVSTE